MIHQCLGKLCCVVLAVAVCVAVTPGSILAQHGGGGGDGGNGGNKGQGYQGTLATACTDDPDATGQVQYLTDRGGIARFLTVQVNAIATANVVQVCVNGTFVGFIALDEFGNGSALTGTGYYGSGVFIPIVNAGDELEVYDAVDGTLILVGTFQYAP